VYLGIPPKTPLDPLARHDFIQSVMETVAAEGVSVVLSSHVVAELERMADYLIVLSFGQVQVAGEVDDLDHRQLRDGPERPGAGPASVQPARPAGARQRAELAEPQCPAELAGAASVWLVRRRAA